MYISAVLLSWRFLKASMTESIPYLSEKEPSYSLSKTPEKQEPVSLHTRIFMPWFRVAYNAVKYPTSDLIFQYKCNIKLAKPLIVQCEFKLILILSSYNVMFYNSNFYASFSSDFFLFVVCYFM